MPYLGNTAANRFVASKAATQFSGDGSETAFTLDHAVGSDEDILVSVDGVIQEPSVAYSVSGTTLTFTAAPSSNSGNNIFVYYLFRTVGTVSHPSSNALEATSGTFSDAVTINDGDAGSVTANTVADELVVESSGAGGVSILTPDASDANLFLGGPGANAGAIVRWNDNSNLMSIGTNNTGGTMALKIGGFTDALTIDASGHVLKPLQSAFSVELTSEAENKTGNGTGFQLGSLGSTERFDRNGDVNNFLFTAPVTGLYLISIMIMYDGFGSASSGFAQIQTSNRIYQCALFHPQNSANVGVNHMIVATYLCDMDANDTAQPLLYISGTGSDAVDLQATETRMSGILVA